MKNNLEYAILNLESARILGGLWGAIIGDALLSEMPWSPGRIHEP